MFSGAVKLLDLNDYIRPSEECVVLKPAVGPAKLSLLFEGAGAPASLIKLKGEKGTLSLADCLACAGCVTSSEALLVEAQSVSALLRAHGGFRFKVALVTPQSLAALAVCWNESLEAAFGRLTQFFTSQLGFSAVFDCYAFAQLVGLRAALEFERRGEATLLCSECPGWVCYLEKTLGEGFARLASREKPPQLVQAEAVKNFAVKRLGFRRDECFAMLIAACFDKKLEASREALHGVPPIDLVISTEEARTLLGDAPPADPQLPVSDSYALCRALFYDFLWTTCPLSELRLSRAHSAHGSSNGYADQIISAVFGPSARRVETHRRGANLLEIAVEAEDGGPRALFALVYGFKHIQYLVREVKAGRCKYDYVEVMACPGGCAGGGGQIPGQSVEAVRATMDAAALSTREDTEFVRRLVLDCRYIEREFYEYPIKAIGDGQAKTTEW